MLQVTQVIGPSGAHSGVDVTVILGVLGTLLGTILGAWISWLVQTRQQLHEDQTRFHERRIVAYAEFNTACNNFVSKAAVPGAAHPTEDMWQVLHSFEVVRLIASQPVMAAANRVHLAVVQINVQAQARQPPAVIHPLVAQFNAVLGALCTAMRNEVGVNEPE